MSIPSALRFAAASITANVSHHTDNLGQLRQKGPDVLSLEEIERLSAET